MHPNAKPPILYRAEFGWLGPVLLRHSGAKLYVGLGSDPLLGDPDALCMMPMRQACGLPVGPRTFAWQVDVEAVPLEHLPQTLATGRRGDWVVEELPEWVVRARVRYLAVLLLYRQGRSIDVHDKFLKGTLGIKPPGQIPDPAVLDAQLRAIDETLTKMSPGEHPLPAGLVHLHWTEGKNSLSLALGSCQYPAGIVNQFPGYESWQRLNVRTARHGDPDLIVLTGDQVYADATAGLFDPAQLDDRFRKPYETLLSNCHVRDALRCTPLVATLDDHEIDENWEPIAARCPPAAVERNQTLLRDGVEAFVRFQRPPSASAPLWFSFAQNRVPLFLMDTRAERQLRAATEAPSGMVSPAQFAALTHWLLSADPDTDTIAPKLVVSPAALFPRHRCAGRARLADGSLEASDAPAALRSDGWDGYPQTFHALLAFIAQHNLRRLVFLSGDEHLGLHSTATLDGSDGKPVVVHSIHSPGLNIPYRFANAARSGLVLEEQFEFHPAGELARLCTVATNVFDGAGFVMVTVEKTASAGWELSCEFPSAKPFRIAFD